MQYSRLPLTYEDSYPIFDGLDLLVVLELLVLPMRVYVVDLPVLFLDHLQDSRLALLEHSYLLFEKCGPQLLRELEVNVPKSRSTYLRKL